MKKITTGILALVAIVLFGFLILAPVSPLRISAQTPPDVLGPVLNYATPDGLFATPNETTICGSNHSTPTANEQMMVTLTNQLRSSHNLQPLSISPSLEKSADTHSLQMASTGVFAHDSYGATLARTQSCGSPTQSIDENIAGNSTGDPTATFNQYVNSPPHLANLLDPNMVSVGVSFEEGIYNDGTTTWPNFFMNTMTFASTADSNTNPQPTPTPTQNPTPQPTPTPGTVTAQISGPSQASVNQSVTFVVTGSGASQPWFAILFGDGTSATWQQGTTFAHTYTTAGTYTVSGYYGDGSNGQTSTPATMSIVVSTSTPTPSANCQEAYFRNGILTQGPVINCP